MSTLRCLRRHVLQPQFQLSTRLYASKPKKTFPSTPTPAPTPVPEPTKEKVVSSCPESTILVGVNYLKDQAQVLAKKDEEYPPWLWDLLKPKVIPDDGPGGIGEKIRMRKENRARIREQNFMKTQ